MSDHVPSDHILDDFLGKHGVKVKPREFGEILGQLRKAFTTEAAPAIQEAVAYRIASKLNVLSTERAQADDMNASRNFKQAADVAVRVAKGGW